MSKKNDFYNSILTLEEQLLKKVDTDSFSKIASEFLAAADLSSFEGLKTFQDCIFLARTVPQYYSAAGFGKSNLTLVNNGLFFIILMFMDDLSTEIHDHPFVGAFRPIGGRPFEMNFLFHQEEQVSDRIYKGTLESKGVMEIHSAVAIDEGKIHHLSRPSGGQYSLLIGKVTGEGLNSTYLYPSLKLNNRRDYSYLARVLSLIEHDDTNLDTLLGSLEQDEKLALMARFVNSSRKKDRIRNWLEVDGGYSTLYGEHDKFLALLKTRLGHFV